MGVSAVVGVAAAALSGLVLYERIIVPLLPTVRVVPLWWWALASSPLWIGALGLGWWAGSLREVLVGSLAATLGGHVYFYWASITNRQGLGNQPLAETDPLTFWTVTLLIHWVLLGMPFTAGYVGKRLLARLSGNSGMQPTAFGRD